MSNKVTFDDLMAEVEESYKAVEFEGPTGDVFSLRAVAVLPRHDRKAVTDAVKVVNSKESDVDEQESAIDDVLLAVVDNAEGFRPVLDALPLGAKAKLIQVWSEATQAPEA
ncbi:tape measure chaperone [Streptomyces phage Sycamore]|uniref:Tape measure chaperone n=1 Tax=Streptomyces phage Sycamore TaxID=2767589 RepID=A0A873WPE9_9CAUD|nr:tape measure chaperone [Streptomyces phage Sycamore]